AAHHQSAEEYHATWSIPIHQTAQERGRYRRDERPHGECTGGEAQRPAQLLVNPGKEEGKSPRYRHNQTQCDEGDSHDDPTIKERPAAPHAWRKTHWTRPHREMTLPVRREVDERIVDGRDAWRRAENAELPVWWSAGLVGRNERGSAELLRRNMLGRGRREHRRQVSRR